MNSDQKPFDDQMQLNECSEQYLYENVSSEMINPSYKFLPIYTNNETNYSDLKQNIKNIQMPASHRAQNNQSLTQSQVQSNQKQHFDQQNLQVKNFKLLHEEMEMQKTFSDSQINGQEKTQYMDENLPNCIYINEFQESQKLQDQMNFFIYQEQQVNSQETESKSNYSRRISGQTSSKKQFELQNQLFQNSNFDGFENRDYYLIKNQNTSYENYNNYENQNETSQNNLSQKNLCFTNNYINIYDDASLQDKNQSSSMKKQTIKNQSDEQSTVSEMKNDSQNVKEKRKRITLRETLQGGPPDHQIENFNSNTRLQSKQSKSALQLLNNQNLSYNFSVIQISKNDENYVNLKSQEFTNRIGQSKSSKSLKQQDVVNANLSKNRIFGWGDIRFEQLQNDQKRNYAPQEIIDLSQLQIKQIACGSQNSLFLSSSNEIYVIGDNDYSQLGIPVCPQIQRPTKIDIHIPEFFIKQKTVFDVSQICTSICSHHSMILLTSRFNQILLGSGLNSFGQLGLRFNQDNPQIVEGFYDIQNVNYDLEDNMIIVKIGCGFKFSALILAVVGESYGKREEIWIWGRMGENSDFHFGKISKIKLQGSSKDMLCGSDSILLLMNDGNIFIINEFLEFNKIKKLPKIVEISISTNRYAALDINNQIYVWDQDDMNGTLMKIESLIYLKNLTFQKLTIGSNFGHTIDEYGNLYGWGQNINGEIGTGDTVPRSKICQIKILDNQEKLMRCNSIFSGQNFVIGIFEPIETTIKNYSSRALLNQKNKIDQEIEKQLKKIKVDEKIKERKSFSQVDERISRRNDFQEKPKQMSHSANNFNRIQYPIKQQINQNHNEKDDQHLKNREFEYNKTSKNDNKHYKNLDAVQFNYKTAIFDETYQNVINNNTGNPLKDKNEVEKDFNQPQQKSERRIKKLNELEREAQIRKTAEAISQYRQVYDSFNKNLQIISQLSNENQETLTNINVKEDAQKNNFREQFIENIQKLNNSREQYKTNTIQSTIDIDTSNSQLQQLKYSPDFIVTKLQPNQTIVYDNTTISPPVIQSNVQTLRAFPKDNQKQYQDNSKNQIFQNLNGYSPLQISQRVEQQKVANQMYDQGNLEEDENKKTIQNYQRQRELSWNDEKSSQLSVKRVQGELSVRNQNQKTIKSPITTNQNPISMVSDSKPHSSFNVTKVFAQNNPVKERIDEISYRNTNPFKNKSILQYSHISENNENSKSYKFGQREMFINETFRTSSQNNENSNYNNYENQIKGLGFKDREISTGNKQFQILTKEEWKRLPSEITNQQPGFNLVEERRGRSHDMHQRLSQRQIDSIIIQQNLEDNHQYNLNQKYFQNHNDKEQYNFPILQNNQEHFQMTQISEQQRIQRFDQNEFDLQSAILSGEHSHFNDTRQNINFNDKSFLNFQFLNASNKDTTPRSTNQNEKLDTFNQEELQNRYKMPFFMNQNDKHYQIDQSKIQSVQKSLLSTASLGKKQNISTNYRQSISSGCQNQQNVENNEFVLFDHYQNPPTVSSIDQQNVNNYYNFARRQSADSINKKSSIDDIYMAKNYQNNYKYEENPYCKIPQEFGQKFYNQENKENFNNIKIAQSQDQNQSNKSQENLFDQKDQKSIKSQNKIEKSKLPIPKKKKLDNRQNHSEREIKQQNDKQSIQSGRRSIRNKKGVSISTTQESKRETLTAVSTISHSKTDLQDVIVNVGVNKGFGHHKIDSNSTNLIHGNSISSQNLDNLDPSLIELKNYNERNYVKCGQNQHNDQKIQNNFKTINNQEASSQENLGESIQFRFQQNQIFEDLQEKMQITKQKLNKYKRKLKKYIHKNQENEREISFYKNQNEQLKKQNEVLIQCDEKKEGATMIVLQQQHKNFEEQMFLMRREYQSQIDHLVEENQQILEELQQKDDNQRLFQEKFQFVENQIQNLDSSLKDQTDANLKLKQQIIEMKSKEQFQNQKNEALIKDYQRMNEENQNMMIDYGKLKEEIQHLQKVNESLEKALQEQSRHIHQQNQGVFEAVCKSISQNEFVNKQEEPLVFMLNQDSRDSLNMVSSASFSQGRALDKNFLGKPQTQFVNYQYEIQKRDSIQSVYQHNCQLQDNHNSAALSFQPSLTQLNNEIQEQLNQQLLLNQNQYIQTNTNNSLNQIKQGQNYISQEQQKSSNNKMNNTNDTRQVESNYCEKNNDFQGKSNKVQTANSSSLQTINTQETQYNVNYRISPEKVSFQGFNLNQEQNQQRNGQQAEILKRQNQQLQSQSRTQQLEEKYSKIIQQTQIGNNDYDQSVRFSQQNPFSQLSNLDDSNILRESKIICNNNNQQNLNQTNLAFTSRIQQIHDLPKQNFQEIEAQFPNFEYVQKKYLQLPNIKSNDKTENEQLNQLPFQAQKNFSPQNSYTNPINENIKKEEQIRVQTSIGKENQLNVGSTSQSTFKKIFSNNIHQISQSSKISEFETQYQPNQIRMKDLSQSYQEKFKELSFEQQEKLIIFIQSNASNILENPIEDAHQNSIIHINKNQVVNKRIPEKPIRLEYGNNLKRYINHEAGLKMKDEFISNQDIDEQMSHRSVKNSSRHYKSKSEKGTSSGLCSNTHKSRSLNCNSICQSVKNCPDFGDQSKIIDYKDSILSKFEKRTNGKINVDIKKRDQRKPIVFPTQRK